jgi:hypothetical protein
LLSRLFLLVEISNREGIHKEFEVARRRSFSKFLISLLSDSSSHLTTTDHDMSNFPKDTQVNEYPAIRDSDSDSESDSSQSLLAHGTDYPHQSLYNGTSIKPRREPSFDRARRKSFIEEDEDPLQLDTPEKKKKEIVTWSSLPHKSQLAILTVARLSEPLVQTSLRVSPRLRSQIRLRYNVYSVLANSKP